MEQKKNAQEVPQLNANQGCKYTPALKLFYNIESQSIQQSFINKGWAMIQQDSTVITDIGNNGQHCITVSGADNKSLNVIIGRNL